jgi:hypothetical protein
MRKKTKKRVSPPLHSWASDAREQVVASDCHEAGSNKPTSTLG